MLGSILDYSSSTTQQEWAGTRTRAGTREAVKHPMEMLACPTVARVVRCFSPVGLLGL